MDDPGSTIISIVLYCLLIVASAYFSGTEISLASVNRIHMMSLADENEKNALRVLEILDNFDEALTVLLIGNNLVNIGCATISVVLATKIWGTTAVSAATVITTLLLFIFGEMLPKCYAHSCNEKFAMSSSPILLFLMKILKPFSIFFTAISKAVSKPFVNRIEPEVTVTEDEFNEIVENITEEEDFDEEKGELVKSALKLSNLTAAEVMTPWDEVLKINAGTKNESILEIIRDSTHSRIPVISRNGSVRGILHIRRFLKAYIKNPHIVLASVLDYPYYAKSDVLIDDLLTQMSNHRRNLAVIKNPQDEILGIVTIEDILEELVGEIYDEDDIGGGEDE